MSYEWQGRQYVVIAAALTVLALALVAWAALRLRSSLRKRRQADNPPAKGGLQ